MNNQSTTKSWIFAASVTAILLLCLSQKASADSALVPLCDTGSFTGEKFQLARGDTFASVPQRRTYAAENSIAQSSAEPSKEMSKDKKGVQGPAGKTPAERGPQGKSPNQPNDMHRIPGDAAEGCSKYLRCSGD